jgi:hypothetical protein
LSSISPHMKFFRIHSMLILRDYSVLYLAKIGVHPVLALKLVLRKKLYFKVT